MANVIKLTADQVTSLMKQLPADHVGISSGFLFDNANGLLVPDDKVDAVNAIISVAGWDKK